MTPPQIIAQFRKGLEGVQVDEALSDDARQNLVMRLVRFALSA